MYLSVTLAVMFVLQVISCIFIKVNKLSLFDVYIFSIQHTAICNFLLFLSYVLYISSAKNFSMVEYFSVLNLFCFSLRNLNTFLDVKVQRTNFLCTGKMSESLAFFRVSKILYIQCFQRKVSTETCSINIPRIQFVLLG